jgi:predicted  nucleic acid-binding Zn-ribbon protein
MLEREFRSLLLKVIRDLKLDTNKQINKLRKSIQDLDKKVSIIPEKFSKEMKIMKNNQVEILGMKISINQIQTTMVGRQDQIEERISEMEDKIEELLHTKNHKEKIIYMNTTYKNSET